MCFLEESYEKMQKNSNFENFESTLYSKSGSMPLNHKHIKQKSNQDHIISYHLSHIQWRNSYGLRVDKPVGTRAERAPAGAPSLFMFQLRLPFQKGASFQHFLFHS